MAKQKRIRKPVVGVPYDEVLAKAQMAAHLKAIRAAFELTVGALASDLGIPASTYRNYEAGVSWLPYDVILRLATKGANLNYLFYGVGEPKQPSQAPRKRREKASEPEQKAVSAT